MRLNELLSKPLPLRAEAAPIAAISRTAQWWLDLVRNLLVVGALQYVAFKTGSVLLEVLSIGTYLFFWIYFVTRGETWSFNPFSFVRDARLHRALAVLSQIVVALIPLALGVVLYMSIDQIARAQGRPGFAANDATAAAVACRRGHLRWPGSFLYR